MPLRTHRYSRRRTAATLIASALEQTPLAGFGAPQPWQPAGSKWAGWRARVAPCLPGYPQKGNLIVCVQNHLVMLQKSKYPNEEGSAGKGHRHDRKGSVVHQIKLTGDDKKVHGTLWEQVARTVMRFCFSFFCLTSGLYPRGMEASCVRC